MARPKRVWVEDYEHPREKEAGHYVGLRIVEAIVRQNIAPPKERTLEQDIHWLLDNAIKDGECLDIGRGYDIVRHAVGRYTTKNSLPRGTYKVRVLKPGWSRVWKIARHAARSGTE